MLSSLDCYTQDRETLPSIVQTVFPYEKVEPRRCVGCNLFTIVTISAKQDTGYSIKLSAMPFRVVQGFNNPNN